MIVTGEHRRSFAHNEISNDDIANQFKMLPGGSAHATATGATGAPKTVSAPKMASFGRVPEGSGCYRSPEVITVPAAGDRRAPARHRTGLPQSAKEPAR